MPQTAQFNLQTDQTQFSIGKDFAVSVFVDPGNQPTNTIFTRIAYPQNKLQFIESTFNDSQYPSIVERKAENGLIKLTSFTTTPFAGNNGLFTRLTFRPLSDGEISITIDDNSKIHADDGKGTDIADPANLPVSLSLFVGEQTQQPIIRKGETLSIVDQQQPPLLAPNTQTGPTPFDFTKKNVDDYSTFSGYPKVYPPGQKPVEQYTLFGIPILFLLLAFVFLFLLFFLLRLLKKGNKPKII